MSLQKDDASLKMAFYIQILIFIQALIQPILPEQKRDVKLSDTEKQKLEELESSVLSALQNDQPLSSGHHIAKLVLESEPHWCRWKEEKAPGFEKP